MWLCSSQNALEPGSTASHTVSTSMGQLNPSTGQEHSTLLVCVPAPHPLEQGPQSAATTQPQPEQDPQGSVSGGASTPSASDAVQYAMSRGWPSNRVHVTVLLWTPCPQLLLQASQGDTSNMHSELLTQTVVESGLAASSQSVSSPDSHQTSLLRTPCPHVSLQLPQSPACQPQSVKSVQFSCATGMGGVVSSTQTSLLCTTVLQFSKW
mmetsp:Transcript_83340/g.222870  ORF Transcript_83340/g.222870 Transcript_83340/m.222870 type:complete len:209 (+) Transcript_83340:3134-3760(+)